MRHKKILAGCILLLISSQLFAQKYLVIDRYGTKRERLNVGDEIIFKQKMNPTIFTDHILALGDSSLMLEDAHVEMKLSEFERFQFQRDGVLFVSAGTNVLGSGFLIAAAVHPLVSNAQYDAGESALIGGSFLLIGQVLRLFKWRKYKIGKRARVRIIDTTFRKQ